MAACSWQSVSPATTSNTDGGTTLSAHHVAQLESLSQLCSDFVELRKIELQQELLKCQEQQECRWHVESASNSHRRRPLIIAQTDGDATGSRELS
jgi:hypothetical protein